MRWMFRLWSLFWCSLIVSNGYRLNVPRVLLPYYPDSPVTFHLVVSDPENGCFTWRTTRPDIVSVKALNPVGIKECSAEAQIAAISKHAEEQTAVVFAEDKDANIVLSCGVTVDVIRTISISTTTKVLFLDASPAKISVYAYNAEGDMFTSLGEIPFEWHLKFSSLSEKPLRIVPFSQSKYEASDGIRLLEEMKKRGHVILVEGISTGAAVLKAGLVDSYFRDVDPQTVELTVVANLLLVPSEDIFLPLGSIVSYSAEIVKQGATEAIRLPSKQYHLTIRDPEICLLDPSVSAVTAISYGTTEILLIDENVKSLTALKPPSARIHVVEPSSLYFKVSGDSWYLETGREYYISVIVTDTDDNSMYISANANFDTIIPAEYFEVITKSKNGTYIHVKAVKGGTAKLRSTFVSLTSREGERRISSSITGEVSATISEPVEIVPSSIVFPYIDGKKIHSRKLSARGGTGLFTWSSLHPEIASMDSSGTLLSGKIGETEVIARDVQNNAHFGKAVVWVLRPIGIAFGKSRVEAEVGSDLILYVSLHASSKNGKVIVSDCRQADFLLKVKSSNIFRIASGSSREVSPYGDGCSSFVLKAVDSGDTHVTVQFGALSASIRISAYPSLKLETPMEVLLMLGSSFILRTSGGPRPWILDPSKYYLKLVHSDASNLISDSTSRNGQTLISCKDNKGDATVLVVVGNEATATNPLPAKAEMKMRVCCGVPTRLDLSLSRSHQSSCPANVRAVSNSQPSMLAVSALGHCESGPSMGIEKQFDSLTSLEVKWSVDDVNIARVVEDREGFEVGKVHGILKPRKIIGGVEVVASTRHYKVGHRERNLPQKLQSAMRVDLVENARAVPSVIVLLNEKRASKTIRLERGSGYFALAAYDKSLVDAALHNCLTEVRPLAVGKSELHFTDLCIGKNFTAAVSVTDMEEILIDGPGFIAMNSEQAMKLKIRDVEGSLFVTDDADIMNVQLNSSSNALAITRIDALHYVLRGDTVGVVTLRASARRANGQMLQSHSHSIQVYAPLRLHPKVITLIPDSVFQLEVSGGPQPLPPVRYRLNDTSVARVAPNGLVISRAIGCAKIVGSISLDNNASIEDHVIVKTVSFAGIRIRLSTSRLQIGEKAWARVNGIAEDETPFSFGGALLPLAISWTITTPDVVEALSPVDTLMTESSENRFQVELKALMAGQAIIHVSVTVPTNSKAFFNVAKHYDDQIAVTVVEPLQLNVPPRYPQALRLSPDAELNLRSNREEGSIQFMVPLEYSTYIAIIGDTNSTLRARIVGDAALMMREVKDPYKELIYLPVSVTPVASLHLEVKCCEVLKKSLTVLPLGYHLHVVVESRDHLGRLFDAAKHSLNYRPHRFDLTEIRPGNDNRSFDIQLKDVGETVFKVWDRDNPDLAVFLRLPVDDVIKPSVRSTALFEIICFKSPLPTSEWKELSAKRHYQFVDEKSGIAVAVDAGSAIVASYDSQKQTIFTKRKVVPAKSLSFSAVPQFVSNIKGRQYLFPIIIDGGEQSLSNVHGCMPKVLEKLRLDAPFDCSVSFVGEVNVLASSLLRTRSAFLPTLGKYGCILEEQTFKESHALMEYQNLVLNISAIWNRAEKVKQASVLVTFYPRFEVIQHEIHLNNVNALEADLVIHSHASVATELTIETGARSVLRISQVKSALTSILRYRVALDTNSALLLQELLEECNITVTNTITGQYEVVPVTVVLHGDTSKAVLRASGSLLILLRAFLESTIVQVCASLLTAGAIITLIAYCNGYSFSSFLFSSEYNADPSTTYGLFAKDHSEWRSSLTHVGGRNVLGSRSPDFSPLSNRSSRSAGSPGEPILWSVPDGSLSPSLLRERRMV